MWPVAEEVNQFVTHLKMKPTMKFSPGVIIFLLEQAVLGIWKLGLDLLSRLSSVTSQVVGTPLSMMSSAREQDLTSLPAPARCKMESAVLG